MAERAGFEPAVAMNHTAFREQHLKPLGHLSNFANYSKANGVRTIAMKEPSRRTAWYAWQDSNLRPFGPQPNALSPELQARNRTECNRSGILAPMNRNDSTACIAVGGEGGIRTLGRSITPTLA